MLLFEINIKNISKEITLPVIACVKAPTETISYTSYINNKNVALAYFESKENVSDKNIYVQDLSWRLPENNRNLLIKDAFVEAKSFSSAYKELLITNKFYIDKQGAEVPLYYKHKTKFLQEPRVTSSKKGNFTEESSFIFSDGYLYTNLNNQVRDYDYLIYSIVGTGTDGKSVNEILSLTEAVPLASEDSVNEEGVIIETCYFREERTNSFDYIIFKSSSGCLDEHTSSGFYIKALEDNCLKLSIRKELKQENAWNVTVKNNILFSGGRKYWLPEYEMQPFNPKYGVLKALNQTCKILNLVTIKINQTNLFTSKDMPLEIKLYNSENKYIKNINASAVDHFNGIVRLTESIGDLSYTVKANYGFKSNELIYTKLNANAFENKKMLDGRYFFYIKSNAERGTNSLFHLYIDEESIIREVSEQRLLLRNASGNYNQDTVIGKTLEEFKELYCYGYENQYQYMELGEVSYKDNCLLEETKLEDIRNFNGILDIEKAADRQWKILQSRHGYGEDGQTVQKNNVLVVEVPIRLLGKYGGSYTEQEVLTAVKRRIPAGTEVIIDYKYPVSKLTIDQSSKVNTISYSWEGSYMYELQYSKNKNNWTPIDSRGSNVEVPANYKFEFEHTDLTSKEVLYYRCIIKDDEIEFPPSNIYGVYTI